VEGVPNRAAPLVDPVTGGRIPLLERVSVVLHPRPKGLSRGFDVRPAARARRIIELTTGEPVRLSRRKYPFERLVNPIPGVKRNPKTGRFMWPRKYKKGHRFKFSLTFRGQTIIGEATRDDLTRKILGSLGASKLTDVERARLWKGPSGKRAAAAAMGVDPETVPDDFGARQRMLDEEGIDGAPFDLQILA